MKVRHCAILFIYLVKIIIATLVECYYNVLYRLNSLWFSDDLLCQL